MALKLIGLLILLASIGNSAIIQGSSAKPSVTAPAALPPTTDSSEGTAEFPQEVVVDYMKYPAFEEYSYRAGLSQAESNNKDIKNTYLTNIMYFIEDSSKPPYSLFWVNTETHKSAKDFLKSAPDYKEPKFSEMTSKYNKTYKDSEKEIKKKVFDENMARLPVATKYSDMTPEEFEKNVLPVILKVSIGKDGKRVLEMEERVPEDEVYEGEGVYVGDEELNLVEPEVLETKVEPKVETKVEPKKEAKVEPKVDAKKNK